MVNGNKRSAAATILFNLRLRKSPRTRRSFADKAGE
jgi:hypothetical protein